MTAVVMLFLFLWINELRFSGFSLCMIGRDHVFLCFCSMGEI